MATEPPIARKRKRQSVHPVNAELLTVRETAKLLRTTPKGVYTMIERGKLPGVVRLGRRVLVRSADLRKHLGLAPVAPEGQTVALATDTRREKEGTK